MFKYYRAQVPFVAGGRLERSSTPSHTLNSFLNYFDEVTVATLHNLSLPISQHHLVMVILEQLIAPTACNNNLNDRHCAVSCRSVAVLLI